MSAFDAPLHEPTTAGTISGSFVWHDLMSPDSGRSVAFYTALFGWRAERRPIAPGGAYTYLHAGDHAFGGIVPFDAVPGWPSHGVSYVAVDDVDATCARAGAGGGSTCIAPTDIPGTGRVAGFIDPTGAVIAVGQSPIGHPSVTT